jgi:hypothetical protein
MTPTVAMRSRRFLRELRLFRGLQGKLEQEDTKRGSMVLTSRPGHELTGRDGRLGRMQLVQAGCMTAILRGDRDA